ncbi:DNA cytosine methyltransferase [Nocardiopsis dassonvillei]|uniref:DNA cytosine methyltransferase n=1 Tax=Nocardiopsis dassonvillei TaxID=2014 RepID=UPI0033E6B6CE
MPRPCRRRHSGGRRHPMTTTLPPNQHAAPDPTTVTIGSLCTGYAGLDMGVAAALNGNARLLWTADNDPHITRLLTHRLPDAPNLGNLASVRWASLEPPQVLTAGLPCQDVSSAGHGAGIEKGTRSGVWHHVMDAVRHLRPRLLVLENVAALRWKGRGLDRVLADLARAGYDASWCCVRACDIGACHRRERVFVVAHPVRQRRSPGLLRPPTAHTVEAAGAGRRCAVPPAPHPRVRTHPHCVHHGPRSRSRASAAHTPGQRRHQRQPWVEGFTRAPHTAPRGHRYPHRRSHPETPNTEVPFAYAWGEYEPTVQRWEKVLGRAAPPPTEFGTRGQPRLSAALVERMMDLPEGWVTDPGLALPRAASSRRSATGWCRSRRALPCGTCWPRVPMPRFSAKAAEVPMPEHTPQTPGRTACRGTGGRAAAGKRGTE